MEQSKCKICGSSQLVGFEHTARCSSCGVMLYYPYPDDDSQLLSSGEGKKWEREKVLDWYSRASFYNHTNFTNMLRFTMGESEKVPVAEHGIT